LDSTACPKLAPAVAAANAAAAQAAPNIRSSFISLTPVFVRLNRRHLMN
jgi:hypothetical protein